MNLYQIFEEHIGCFGLYIKEIENNLELRCFDRTHGGKDLLLISIRCVKT